MRALGSCSLTMVTQLAATGRWPLPPGIVRRPGLGRNPGSRLTGPMFIPPARADRIRAVGPVAGLPPGLRRALQEQGFDAILRPGPHDWLASHPERGQTFAAFLAGHPVVPGPAQRTLYLQPLGQFHTGNEPPLDLLSRFAAAFFALQAVVLPVVPVTSVTTRINSYTGARQLLTRDLLALLAQQRPASACCVVGITMDDLYPDPAWNFVFGEASPRERVGVYSFARYLPGEAGGAAVSLLLRRSCKVLAHETAHLLGIAHCVFYSCLMNGSNNLPESDARPLHLCPVDLRKLQHSTGFDVAARYRDLLAFTEDAGFTDEARWLTTQLLRIEQDQAGA
jgi:archaemetzincin